MLTVDQIYILGQAEALLTMAETAHQRGDHEHVLSLLREAKARLSSVLDGEGEGEA